MSGAVIALTPDNLVVIAEQFRPGPNKVMLELPAGFIDPGEDPKAGTMRELLEETGYASDDVEFLGASHWTAYENLESHYFLARDCRKVANQSLDPDELINVKLITIDELIDNATNDLMCDKAAILFAYEKLKKIKEGNN
ncbi:NUDIX hydrolase [Candidatus Saccharibacteria bacterium]|nr:NUDIX hydrolase [Candidatus Saccharibacteria bacterium]